MTELSLALRRSSGALIGVAFFSAVMNLLMLTGPLFMMQVYDRVLSSRSSATLLVLTSIIVFLFALMGLLDFVRGRVLARIGAGFQADMDARVFGAVLRQADVATLREKPASGLRDLSAIQSVLASPATGAVFDLPWTPVFLVLLFIFHPVMGWFAVGSCILVFSLAVLNQRRTVRPQTEAQRLGAEAEARTELTRRSVETVNGLGMGKTMSGLWQTARSAALDASLKAADTGGSISAVTKSLRMFLQSAVLALGAFLVLRNQLTSGAMIAGSILLGRALAPIEQIVGFWPQSQKALAAWKSLDRLLSAIPETKPPMALPRPAAEMTVRDLVVVPPGETAPTLAGVSLEVHAGDAVAVIGPSASGKSSLARALTGIWPAARGEVRLGGADLSQYDRGERGRLFGYVAQDVDLFPGSVSDNIARFEPEANPANIVAAAQAAAAHEMILGLPKGYDTVITEGGGRLSGGQRQRIGLARAFYGNPVVLVLDEPNASLDDPGVQALNRAIGTARAAGKIVFVMSHRPSALAECNLILFLDGGRQKAFGPKEEVMKRILRPAAPVLAALPERNQP